MQGAAGAVPLWCSSAGPAAALCPSGRFPTHAAFAHASCGATGLADLQILLARGVQVVLVAG